MSTDPVTAEISYGPQDLETYRRLAQRSSAARMGAASDLNHATMLVVAGLSIAAAFAAHAIGAVPDVRNPAVAVLCALTFYGGRFVETRTLKRMQTNAWRGATTVAFDRSITIAADAQGLTSSSAKQRHWYAWSSVKDVTSRDGLIVFWIHDWSGIVLPRRFVSSEEARRIIAFARANPDAKS